MKILIDNGHGQTTPGKRSPMAAACLAVIPENFRKFDIVKESLNEMKRELLKKLSGILAFYAIAVGVRAAAMQIAPPSSLGFIFLLRGWAEGLGPCLGALAAVILFKRKFYCSISGTSLIRSLISVAIPFFVCLVLDWKLSFMLLGFIFYSFLEEVGWRGYLQGELNDKSEFARSLIIGAMWFVWHLRFKLTLGSLIFLAVLILGSWGIGRIAKDTHSLIACACFHTLYNFSIHGFFQFTPAVICIYVAVVISWFVVWYTPWEKMLRK